MLATTCRCRFRRARPRCSGRPARASRRSCGCSTGWPTRTRARCASTATTCASWTRSSCAAAPVLVPQLPAPLPGTRGRQRAVRAALVRPRGRRRAPGWTAPASTRSFADRDASRLSVGEQQRVMLARALALEPEVLLLDEPTSALDETRARRVEQTLRDLRDGVSIVLVTHDRAQAERLDGAHRPRWTRGRFGSDRGQRREHHARARWRLAGARGGRDRGLVLAPGRARAGHRDRRRALVRPADRRRLRDPGDLRLGQPAGSWSRCWR